MNRYLVTLLYAATTVLHGASLGGCVTGDIPAPIQPTADGSTPGSVVGSSDGGGSNDAISSDDAAKTGEDGSSGGGGGPSGGANDATIGDGSLPDTGVADRAAGDGPLADSATDAGTACVAVLYGSYVVRGDGKLLEETQTGLSGSESTVLNGGSGAPLAPVMNVQDGIYHGCAAVAGDSSSSTPTSAWCWRTNSTGNTYGQLGSGAMDTSGPLFHATEVLTAADQPLTNVVSVADGAANTGCAVTLEGKLYCWGDLTWILGGGATLSSAYAVPVTTDGTTPLTNVLQAAVHSAFACAILREATSNEVWCWGSNAGTIANLGIGDSVNHRYPTKVVGPTNPTVVRIADGNGAYGTTCVLDGVDVRCWGASSAIGNTNSNGLNPALVLLQDGSTPLGNVVDLKRGLESFCTLNGDATLWCWGINVGFKAYASQYGALDVNLLGQSGGLGGQSGPSFLTGDGVYHVGTGTRTPSCGPL